MDRPVSGPPPAIRLPAGAVDTHCHVFMAGFGAVPGGPDLPPAAPGPGAYRSVMRWLGFSRTVIVQANAHRTDHGNLLAALAEFGAAARGIGAVAPDVAEADLARLSAAGVVGTRVVGLPGGAVGLDALEAVDARCAAFGWVLLLQFDGVALPELAPRIARLKCRAVIDHHGKFFAGAAPDGPEVAALKRLVDGGRVWFKFAGCYESSTSGPPDYADIAAVAGAMQAHAPDRIVWGTNWPHNLAKRIEDYPDDRALTDTVLGWFPDDAARRKALVETPEALFGFA